MPPPIPPTPPFLLVLLSLSSFTPFILFLSPFSSALSSPTKLLTIFSESGLAETPAGHCDLEENKGAGDVLCRLS